MRKWMPSNLRLWKRMLLRLWATVSFRTPKCFQAKWAEVLKPKRVQNKVRSSLTSIHRWKPTDRVLQAPAACRNLMAGRDRRALAKVECFSNRCPPTKNSLRRFIRTVIRFRSAPSSELKKVGPSSAVFKVKKPTHNSSSLWRSTAAVRPSDQLHR